MAFIYIYFPPIKTKFVTHYVLTQEELKQYLNYDPDTGIFTWIKKKGPRTNIGQRISYKNPRGYIVTRFNQKRQAIHRLAWLYVYGYMPVDCIDHINGIKDDNRIVNLREVKHIENMQNQRIVHKQNKAGFIGVSFHAAGKKNQYQAAIRHNNKQIYIGLFNTPQLAHEAYLRKKRELHPFCTI